MLSCTFVSRTSRHSFNMRLPERLYRRPSTNNGSPRDSHELPRFSFEGDNRPLVSTERLFNQWSIDEETAYRHGFNAIESVSKLEHDIIVSKSTHLFVHNKADTYCRSLGMDRMTLQIRLIGHNRANGSLQCLVSTSNTSRADQSTDCE